MGPPRALRVLYLPDRLVLHDISKSLRGDPSDRNALIDAANAVHKRAEVAAEPNLIDLSLSAPPPTSSSNREHYLVIPFSSSKDDSPEAFVTSSAEKAGIPSSPADHLIDAAAGFLGVLPLPSGRFAVLATQCRRAGALPSGSVYSASKVKLVPLHAASSSKEERDLPGAVVKLLESGALYYSLAEDLTRATSNSERRRAPDVPNAFWWTWPLASKLGSEAGDWALRTVYGFVGTNVMRFESSAMPTGAGEFLLTLVSRRSRRRAGTRYITRGVDATGDVANFVETEQIVWNEERPRAYSSYTIIRGSVPVFWRQNNGIAKPPPELDGHLAASRAAFSAHFKTMTHSYGGVTAVSLVDKNGSEGVLAEAFERHFELDLRESDGPLAPKLVAFDFHRHCGGKEYERGLKLLLDQLREEINLYGIYVTGLEATGKDRTQVGVFRVNCVDCLDRTNVVQSMISRITLNMQLDAVFSPEFIAADKSAAPRLYGESEDRFKHIWGDNADAVSKQYSGTGALKTDFTRTGKRSTTGVIGDGMKSVMRMYYKNFVDEGRQEVIDILCGSVVARPPSRASERDADQLPTEEVRREAVGSREVWYSFEAIRINAGGDKQTAFIELCDEAMYVTISESLSLEYPRGALLSWSKYEDAKSSEKKSSGRLRLVYKASRRAPATTSPLDLQFRGGSTARENFLRAVISWAQPESAALLRKKEVEVKVLGGLGVGEHHMDDWGLGRKSPRLANEVIAIVLPECDASTRSWGLAAVPLDIDDSDYVLVSAKSVSERGPAIAVLVSKSAAATVMDLAEAITGRTSTFAASGAVGVALRVCGTSFCFVSAKLNGAQDVFSTLSSLKLGRQTFDVTNQYHHFTLAGLLGDMQWRHSSSASGPASRKYVHLGDGSSCYSLQNGLSVMRNSFPGLDYKDTLTSSSLWESRVSPFKQDASIDFVSLSEGTVEGRPGPRLTQSITHCVVTVSNLRGEDMKTPPGAEQMTQLNSIVVLYCEYATVEGIATKQSGRPTAFPEWKEPLHVLMMPSEPEEIYSSFILGQIAVPTPLNDPISAGYFVVPISAAANGSSDFQVPCRLAGIPTGKISGRIEIEFGGEDLIEKLRSASSQKSMKNGDSDSFSRNRNKLPPISGEKKSSTNPLSQHVDSLKKASSSISTSAGLPSARLPKPSMNEVNGKIDAVRRKGSKQIKSVVNRLSSLLNQPPSSSSVRTPTPDFPSSNSQADTWAGNQEFRDVSDDLFDDIPPPQQSGRSLAGNGNSTNPIPSPSDKSRNQPNSRQTAVPQTRTSSRSSEPSLIDTSDVSGFGGFQAAPARPSSRQPKHAPAAGDDDALLSGLRASLSHASKVASQPRKVPVHASGANDDLLSGLQREKSKGKDPSKSQSEQHDDWGDFEAAGATTSSAFPQRRPQDNSKSLLDF